jgi:hypothetical protein
MAGHEGVLPNTSAAPVPERRHHACAGTVAVRDTKDRSLPPHRYTAAEWTAFLAAVRAAEFDHA